MGNGRGDSGRDGVLVFADVTRASTDILSGKNRAREAKACNMHIGVLLLPTVMVVVTHNSQGERTNFRVVTLHTHPVLLLRPPSTSSKLR